jgi:hypothetical protein
VSAAGPLRGPQGMKEAASPPLLSLSRRAGYGAAPPASRVLRIALRATALRAALDPETPAAPGGRKSGQARACPARARGTNHPPRWRAQASTRTPGEQSELAFDSQKERKNYTNPLLGSLHTFRGLPLGTSVPGRARQAKSP